MTYATLKKRNIVQNEQQIICEADAEDNDKSTNTTIMTTCLDSKLICDNDNNNNNNSINQIKSQQNLPQPYSNNNNNHHHGILQANSTATKNFLSPMIWLLVGWWKLNLFGYIVDYKFLLLH
ncbi:hypothetical protein BLA29_010171 [Euroglyphus maynei]|uniref:Uncharacterized protein n=1 Tax=Euroglyphus maynei TaxID=6958 RepID=A0A1Y3ASD6_EURMA|nr:hypothetical protein BLA29_010171 [Euroglyphus maynei]